MSTVNTGGLTVPDDSDPVAQGAAAMRTIASKLGATAAGSVVLSLAASPGAPNTAAVTFPVGRFTVAPIVVLIRNNGWNPAAVSFAFYAGGITTSGFTLTGQSSVATGNSTILWIAVQTP